MLGQEKFSYFRKSTLKNEKITFYLQHSLDCTNHRTELQTVIGQPK